MQAAVLHLDNALVSQARLRQAVCAGGGREVDCRDLGPELRLWSRPAGLERLRAHLAEALPADAGPAVVFAGSGDFHHITPLLIARAIEADGGGPVTVLHFDNHPDWVRFGRGVHCGSWVGVAARLPGVARILTVGVCSRDIAPRGAGEADLAMLADGTVELYPYGAGGDDRAYAVAGHERPTIAGLGEAAFARFLPGRIETEAVYVTVDKDVLSAGEAGTNWDQGRTSAAFLADLIRAATRGRRLIGADVVGDWSPAAYGGGLLDGLLKRGEAALDQPWRAPPAAMRVRNEAVNLMLLRLLDGTRA